MNKNNSGELMNQCLFINGSTKCLGKGNYECYGGYCKKHRSEHLLHEGEINITHFTDNCKDYKLCELKNYCNTHISKLPSKSKKDDYFKKVSEYCKNHKELSKNNLPIKIIQSHVRRWLITHNLTKRGSAYLNRKLCNNNEDFYTYEPIHEINSMYFFSYKDTQGNYWGFDVRSLKKLIDMNYGNPYTTENIPDSVKEKINRLVYHLDNSNVNTVINTEVVSDRRAAVKQKYVDIFAQMEYVGWSCDVRWILDLNSSKLKRLYRELEDIWNYRANLPNSTKRLIIPPDGRLCVMPVHDFNHCSTKVELQEILASEISKIGTATNSGNMNLGYMYFIIALSYVSRPCFLTHNWVQSVF